MNRINQLKRILKENTAAVITSDVNRFYLSGFNSSAGMVVITNKDSFLLVDFRYYEKAKKQVKDLEVKLSSGFLSDLKELLKRLDIKEIMIETDSLTLQRFNSFKNFLQDFKVLDDNTLSQTLNDLRQIKSPTEIETIKKAQAITDRAFSHILNFIRPSVTEKEIALELEFFMRKNGSDGVSFDTIAVSGKNSSLPHGVPTDKSLQNGDFLTMDFGAKFGGYCSDMTRTVAIGEISDEMHLVYNTVLRAQEAVLKEIGPEKECRVMDKIARDIINNAGFEGAFGHGLGHSVGIEIHENPACNTKDETLLKSGMIMTIEPGIYLENKFGVRIEDMVLITPNGQENLTKSPKSLITL